jgi:two-component sensor histidine kinase
MIACVAAILMAAGLSALFAWRDRDSSYRQARDLTGTVSLLVAEHAARLMETSDLILRQAVELAGPSSPPAPDDRIAWERLKALAETAPYIASIRLTDAEGTVLLDSRQFPATGADAAGAALLGRPAVRDGLIIDRILTEDDTGEAPILLSRPLGAGPGQFHGLAVVAVAPDYLRDIYDTFDIGDERVITLSRRDGSLLMSEPPTSLTDIDDDPDQGISTSRPVRGYDMLAQVTASSLSISAHWRARLWAYATYAAAAMGAVALIGSLAMERARRQREAERALQHANDTLEERVHQRTAELEEANARLEGAVADKEVLLKEVQHRVKNNLQVICSLLRLQAGRIDEQARYGFDESLRRIQSMSLVHELLYRSDQPARINMADYLRQSCDSLVRSSNPAGAKLVLEAQDWIVDPDQAMPLAIITSELVSNALQHAFPSGHPGTVTVALEPVPEGMCLIVRDDGVGLPPDTGASQRQRGLGLVLVQSLVRQTAGTLHIDRSAGTTFTLTIPTDASRRPKAA